MSESSRERAREARDAARAARDAAREARDEAMRADRARRGGRRGGSPPGGDATMVERTLPADGVSEIAVDHTAGKLRIRPCSEDEEPMLVSRGSKTAPEVEVSQSGSRLSIRVKLSVGRLFRRRQGSDTELRIPGHLDTLSVEQGAGRVEVEAITTEHMSVHVGAGDVSVRESEGMLNVEVGAGKVSVREHRGTARVDTGTGDVLVHFARVDAGEHDVSVGLGSAEIQMPPGLEVHARLNSGIGKAQADYPLAGPAAPIQVRIGAGIGRAVLRQASATTSEGAAPPRSAGTGRPQRGGRTSERSEEAGELRILQLMQQGRISPKEAVDLLAALKGMPPPDDEGDDEDQAG